MNHSFKGAAKRLDDIDLPKLGAQIGVGEDALVFETAMSVELL